MTPKNIFWKSINKTNQKPQTCHKLDINRFFFNSFQHKKKCPKCFFLTIKKNFSLNDSKQTLFSQWKRISVTKRLYTDIATCILKRLGGRFSDNLLHQLTTLIVGTKEKEIRLKNKIYGIGWLIRHLKPILLQLELNSQSCQLIIW